MQPNYNSMCWFNEPADWQAVDGRLVMQVTPHTDLWRKTHYGFTVDDAPCLYSLQGGEFEVKVKISGHWKTRFDQAGLLIRANECHYIKTGIEFVNDLCNVSAVVTHDTSDWSMIPLAKPVDFIWIKAVRRLDAVEIYYSFDDQDYTLMRIAWMQDHVPLMVGMVAACPDGEGFAAVFENFQIKHLPDLRRQQWLESNS